MTRHPRTKYLEVFVNKPFRWARLPFCSFRHFEMDTTAHVNWKTLLRTLCVITRYQTFHAVWQEFDMFVSKKPASLFKNAIFGETLSINCDMWGSQLRQLSTVTPRYLKVSTTLSSLLFRSMSALDMGAFFATIIASSFFVFSIRLLLRSHVEIFWRLEFILRTAVSRLGFKWWISVS